MNRLLPSLAVLSLLAGCNNYDLFRLAGYEQESFSNNADILFVIDNSDSMTEEAADLANNFDGFLRHLQAQEEALLTNGLPDAVTNYKAYVRDRAAFVDYQFGIISTEIAEEGAGELLGRPKPNVMVKGDDRLENKFTKTLLCDATCWRDPVFESGDVPYTRGELDDLCGGGDWLDQNCAESGREEGIEAVFLALCRAVPNPPEECFEDIEVGADTFESVLRRGDTDSNRGLLRNNATFIPVIVTDEGDDSRRMETGRVNEEGELGVGVYQDLFAKFATRISWVAIAPPLDENNEHTCTGYTEWGVNRYDFFVDNSNGLKIDIQDPESCRTTDFGDALQELGELLANLLTNFNLQSVPDADTILVFVDGKEVQQSTQLSTDTYGLPIYSDGWTYVPADNAIVFHGGAIPPNDAVVQVYYVPLDAMPRELPF